MKINVKTGIDMNMEMNIKTNAETNIEVNTGTNIEPEPDWVLQQAYKREQQKLHVPAELLAATKAAMEAEAGKARKVRKRRARLYGGFGVAAAVCAVCLIAMPYIGGTVLEPELRFDRGGASGKAESPMMTGSAGEAADAGGEAPMAAAADAWDEAAAEAEDGVAAEAAAETDGAWAEASEDVAEEPASKTESGASGDNGSNTDAAAGGSQEMTDTGGVSGLIAEMLDKQPENFTAEETITLFGEQVHLGKDENREWTAVIEQAEGVLVLSGPGMSKRAFVSEVRKYLEKK